MSPLKMHKDAKRAYRELRKHMEDLKIEREASIEILDNKDKDTADILVMWRMK
jgi:Sec-independent protein translocase protein TatA